MRSCRLATISLLRVGELVVARPAEKADTLNLNHALELKSRFWTC